MNERASDTFTFDLPNDWGAPEWTVPALILGGAVLLLVLWSYRRSRVPVSVRTVCGLLKASAVTLLALILIEPRRGEERPVPGANVFMILADDSQSLQLSDKSESRTRGEVLKAQLDRQSPWQVRLSQDFDVRRYLFGSGITPVDDFAALSSQNDSSAIVSSIRSVSQRFAGRPTAGMLIFSDGNSTDVLDSEIDWSALPPIYPVVIGNDETDRDISITQVTAGQTNFEAAPVNVSAVISTRGYQGETIVAELLDSDGERLQRLIVDNVEDNRPFGLEFKVKPQRRGILFYQIRTYAESEEDQLEHPDESDEATLLNNSRLVLVDRAGGPFKILYVCGRPNWEFKFLNRSIAEDDELELDALIRIAKREPRFKFRDRDTAANPFFRGSDQGKEEQVEQYDEPVIVRVNLEADELRDGFPKSADVLYQYHGIVLDDVEAEFFAQDQKSLIQEFVSRRGGGFLMLGGQESFIKGDYDRTPIGELLPIYLTGGQKLDPDDDYRLTLTREGEFEPWARVRPTLQEEGRRLAEMPPFRTVNSAGAIKPGASLLAQVRSSTDELHAALAVQRFGKGRSGALLVGDIWRWKLHQDTPENDDVERFWRQTARWLVSDVPQRLSVDVERRTDDPQRPVELTLTVRDEEYLPLDNATIAVEVTTPDHKKLALTGEAVDAASGKYRTRFVPRIAGPYKATVTAKAADGTEISKRETGWISAPAAEEFRVLTPNREFLQTLAAKTGGEVIEAADLDDFVNSLQEREVPEMEFQVSSVWHRWSVFLLAIGLLVSEWGVRRWKGLP